MPKPHADQYNLFGGVGAVTETQVAVAAGTTLVDCYLKCDCGRCSEQLRLPETIMGNRPQALLHAQRQTGWTDVCPGCQKKKAT